MAGFFEQMFVRHLDYLKKTCHEPSMVNEIYELTLGIALKEEPDAIRTLIDAKSKWLKQDNEFKVIFPSVGSPSVFKMDSYAPMAPRMWLYTYPEDPFVVQEESEAVQLFLSRYRARIQFEEEYKAALIAFKGWLGSIPNIPCARYRFPELGAYFSREICVEGAPKSKPKLADITPEVPEVFLHVLAHVRLMKDEYSK